MSMAQGTLQFTLPIYGLTDFPNSSSQSSLAMFSCCQNHKAELSRWVPKRVQQGGADRASREPCTIRDANKRRSHNHDLAFFCLTYCLSPSKVTLSFFSKRV